MDRKGYKPQADSNVKKTWIDRLNSLVFMSPVVLCYGHKDLQTSRARIVLAARFDGPSSEEFQHCAMMAGFFLQIWERVPNARISLFYHSASFGLHEYRGGWMPVSPPPELVGQNLHGCTFSLTLEHATPTDGCPFVDDWFELAVDALDFVLGPDEEDEQTASEPKARLHLVPTPPSEADTVH